MMYKKSRIFIKKTLGMKKKMVIRRRKTKLEISHTKHTMDFNIKLLTPITPTLSYKIIQMMDKYQY